MASQSATSALASAGYAVDSAAAAKASADSAQLSQDAAEESLAAANLSKDAAANSLAAAQSSQAASANSLASAQSSADSATVAVGAAASAASSATAASSSAAQAKSEAASAASSAAQAKISSDSAHTSSQNALTASGEALIASEEASGSATTAKTIAEALGLHFTVDANGNYTGLSDQSAPPTMARHGDVSAAETRAQQDAASKAEAARSASFAEALDKADKAKEYSDLQLAPTRDKADFVRTRFQDNGQLGDSSMSPSSIQASLNAAFARGKFNSDGRLSDDYQAPSTITTGNFTGNFDSRKNALGLQDAEQVSATAFAEADAAKTAAIGHANSAVSTLSGSVSGSFQTTNTNVSLAQSKADTAATTADRADGRFEADGKLKNASRSAMDIQTSLDASSALSTAIDVNGRFGTDGKLKDENQAPSAITAGNFTDNFDSRKNALRLQNDTQVSATAFAEADAAKTAAIGHANSGISDLSGSVSGSFQTTNASVSLAQSRADTAATTADSVNGRFASNGRLRTENLTDDNTFSFTSTGKLHIGKGKILEFDYAEEPDIQIASNSIPDISMIRADHGSNGYMKLGFTGYTGRNLTVGYVGSTTLYRPIFGKRAELSVYNRTDGSADFLFRTADKSNSTGDLTNIVRIDRYGIMSYEPRIRSYNDNTYYYWDQYAYQSSYTFKFRGATKGYISTSVATSKLNFTGQHRAQNSEEVGAEYVPGMIVISSGEYCSPMGSDEQVEKIEINEALPKVGLSRTNNDKRVFGVLSEKEDPNDEKREFTAGAFVSVAEKAQGDNRLVINSLGEGGIWVCNINGNLENGDYITSCEVPGYGMRQDDDLLHNYTVAKITCDCDFDLNSELYKCEEFEFEGTTYRKAFVGCTYHCG